MLRLRWMRALGFQIVVSLSVLVITAVVLMGLLITYLSGLRLENEKRRFGYMALEAIQRTVEAQSRSTQGETPMLLRENAQRTGQLFFDARTQHSLSFFSPDREVLWSSLPRAQWSSARLLLTLVPSSPGPQPISGTVEDPVNGRVLLVITASLGQGGTPSGLVQLVLPLATPGEEPLASGQVVMWFIGFYALLVILLGATLLRQTIVRPLKELSNAVTRLLAGERDVHLPLKDPQELRQLAESINALSRELAEHEQRMSEQIEELLTVNDELETTRNSLIRAEKLASIGRLAAGVAHEVGNPLTAILGYVELMRQGGLSEEITADFLRRIAEDTTRIHTIIKGLLDYSRPSPARIERLDLNAVIEETIDLLRLQKQFKRITFDFTSHRRPAQIEADGRQIQQVLVNLFLNASQAMGEEGVITAFLEQVRYDPGTTYRQNANRFHRGDSLITVAVIDQGIGIDEEQQARIFDPFYTTKEPGQGTGLGLSVSDKIIDSFGGAIDVHSHPGEGATFTLLLPEAKPEPEAETVATSEETPPAPVEENE